MPRIDTIKIRRDLASNWTSVNPVLADGEKGYETDTLRHKYGNGSDAWNDLPYAEGQASQTADTGSTIPLDNIFGHFCNLQSANSNTSYTINSSNIVGSYAIVLINASTEPTVTGATQKGGIEFIADTDLELLVQNRGDAGIFYSYMPVAVGGSDADTLQSVTERGATTDQEVTFENDVNIDGFFRSSNGNIYLGSQEVRVRGASNGDFYLYPISGNAYLIKSDVNNNWFVFDNTAGSSAYSRILGDEILIYRDSAKRISLLPNGDSFLNGGNVAIGKTTPNYELDVNGDIGADSVIFNGKTSDDVPLGDGSFTSLSSLSSENFTSVNPFGDILPTAFKEKMYEMDDDLEIVMIGDSLIGLIGSASENADAANLPPACNYNHLTYQFWNALCKNKVVADRWDSVVNTLTESGTFADADVTKFNTPNWSGEYSEHTSICRESNTANASVAFDWDLDAYEKLNFINRKSTDGSVTVTFAVTEGNGLVEILDKSTGTWSEANGATISQYIDPSIATDGSGYSQHVRNWRTKMRKASGATGSVTITASKGASTSEYLYYWGTERWNGKTIHVTNAGRGGRSVFNLQKNFINDVVERKPALVIQSLSLANEFNKTLAQIESDYENFIIFDSGGISMKQQSNDWADFQSLIIVPHGFQGYWDGDQAIKYSGSGWESADQIAYYNYLRVKNHIKNFDDPNVPIIDIGTCLLDEAKNKGWTYEEAFTGTTDVSTASFTKDAIHTNDYGIKHWVKYLYGLFKL